MGINERIKSAAAFEQAQKVIPGGVNSPVRALKSVGTTPLFVREAKGAYFTDIDDNRIIDFCMSWGVFILGHNNAKVSQAAVDAVNRGSSYGIPTLAETTLAEKVREAIPSMERLRFVNSGTEATMSAIRVARGYTGRDILVKFEGNYHGHADHLLVSAGSGVANISNASSAGVPKDFVKHTAVLPYNDVEAREVTEKCGAILIFDEVITGFRLSRGGAQQRFGITPDMTTVGKIVGGGFPAAAFGGRADIMKVLAPEGPVYQAGTLSGNPVAMAAGIETLTQLSRPGFYEELEAKSDAFIAKLEKIIEGKGIQLNRCGSMFTMFFNDKPVRNFQDTKRSDQERFARYFRNMLSRGIYVSPSQFEGNFISETHTPEILDYVLESIAESID